MKRTFLALVMLATLAPGAHAGNREDMMWARDLIRRADLDLARAVAEHSVSDFAALVAEDATCFGRTVTRGRAACVETWRPLITGGKSSLQWAPDEVTVSAARDLGYTIGTYVLKGPGADGKPGVSKGTYVSVWRRDPDNRWRLLVDIGTEPTLVETKEAAIARARAQALAAMASARTTPSIGPAPTWQEELRRQERRRAAAATINPAPTWREEQARQARQRASGPPATERSALAASASTINPAPTWKEELARQERRRAGAVPPATTAAPASAFPNSGRASAPSPAGATKRGDLY